MTERNVALLERPRKIDALPIPELTQDPNIKNLLCGIGTNERRAITAAALGINPAVIYQREGDLLLNPQVKSAIARSKSTRLDFTENCQSALAQGGFVDVIPFPRVLQDVDGYRPNQYFSNIGLSFAGWMLDFSSNHDPSLQELFSTSSSSFASLPPEEILPLVRLNIFSYLLDSQKPVRASDIATLVKRDLSSTGRVLQRLADSNIITYESFSRGDTLSQYTLSPLGLQSHILPKDAAKKGDLKLSALVYDVFRNTPPPNGSKADRKWFTAEDIVDVLISKNTDLQDRDRDGIKQHVYAVCAHLHKNKLIKKNRFKEDIRTEVSLTNSQRKTLTELISLLKIFQDPDQDFLDKGVEKAMDFVKDPEQVKIFMQKASRKSRANNYEADSTDTETIIYAPAMQPEVDVEIPDYNDEDWEWRQGSACLGLETDIFFPKKSRGRNAKIELAEKEEGAKKVCATCPVRNECLEFALHTNQVGIWGGLNEEERELIIRTRSEQ